MASGFVPTIGAEVCTHSLGAILQNGLRCCTKCDNEVVPCGGCGILALVTTRLANGYYALFGTVPLAVAKQFAESLPCSNCFNTMVQEYLYSLQRSAYTQITEEQMKIWVEESVSQFVLPDDNLHPWTRHDHDRVAAQAQEQKRRQALIELRNRRNSRGLPVGPPRDWMTTLPQPIMQPQTQVMQ